MALLLGIALTNISTILIYIGLAVFAALGLDPVIKWLGKHGVKRGWAIVIIFLTGAIVAVGLLLLVVPTLVQQISAFITDIPDTVTNFEKLRLLRVARGDLRHRARPASSTRWRSSSPTRRTSRRSPAGC